MGFCRRCYCTEEEVRRISHETGQSWHIAGEARRTRESERRRREVEKRYDVHFFYVVSVISENHCSLSMHRFMSSFVS